MKKNMVLILVTLLGGLVSAWAFTQPTAEQLEAAANDPTQMESLLQGASTEEAAQVILAVVGEVEKLQIPLAQKKQRVGAILAASRVALGEGAQARTVMAMVLPHISAALLPTVVPGTGPVSQMAPPVAEKYSGQ